MKPKTKAPEGRAPAAWERDAVPADVYAEVASSLASADSPVGIDAKHTHVLILHALHRIEERLGGRQAPGSSAREGSTAAGETDVRGQVRAMLERTPAYAKLSEKERRRLEEGLVSAIPLAAPDPGAAVDFPAFVAELVEGTFEAVVDASVEQMEAYGRLLESATSAVEEFAEGAAGGRLARQRQRLLATMALMGATRVKVGRRGARARMVFAGKDRDEDEDD